MQKVIDLDALIELYEEARAKDNDQAKELLSKAILELVEKQSLEEAIKVKHHTAKALIHAGSL